MQVQPLLERYYEARYAFYRWRYATGVAQKLLLCLGMAVVTGLVAQVRVPLPWSPVPITGQTFAVLLSGVLLGRWYGGLSQALYAAIGAAGVPWFAGWSGGLGVITGATGGYILGFILAALFIGHFTDTYIRSRNFTAMLALMLLANFLLIHGPGLWQLSRFLEMVGKPASGFSHLLWMGTIPFIPGDITKAVAAALIARAITPKVAYDGEVDRGKPRWRLP